jgi:glycosyltransferase involved in cell wall biosynthesis
MMISIITPCRNRVHFVEDAIRCVVEQRYTDVEHIVMDGGSTDGTLDVLAKYPHVKVFSGPDRGMYDAINKGLDKARGEIVGFLNTDDMYAPGCLAEVARTFRDRSIDAMAGKAIIINQTPQAQQEVILEIFPSESDHLWNTLILGIPAFNAWFFRKEAIRAAGGCNSDYRIVADREFLIRFWMRNPTYQKTDRLFYIYRQHPESLTINQSNPYRRQIIDEHLQMIQQCLREPSIPRTAVGLLRQARTRDTLNITTHLLRKRQWSDVWKYMFFGIRHDWTWPARLFFRGFGIIMSYLKKPVRE